MSALIWTLYLKVLSKLLLQKIIEKIEPRRQIVASFILEKYFCFLPIVVSNVSSGTWSFIVSFESPLWFVSGSLVVMCVVSPIPEPLLSKLDIELSVFRSSSSPAGSVVLVGSCVVWSSISTNTLCSFWELLEVGFIFSVVWISSVTAVMVLLSCNSSRTSVVERLLGISVWFKSGLSVSSEIGVE